MPGTVIMFAIAALAGSGILPLSEVAAAGILGGLLGMRCLTSSAGASIRIFASCRPAHAPGMDGRRRELFHRYGIASLLVGRFIGPLRPMLPMIAGMCDMPLPRFIAVSVLAAAGWSIAYLMPGWAAGRSHS
ncbi:DedA family protein, partial [Pseudomonas syringae pv. actinidiae]|nr:DedA family protein [Pseudomonas syringae pv. actinidiae]